MTILIGVIYPLFMTVLAQFFFPGKSNGSMIMKKGEIVGSELIGQKFQSNRYFWSRPSAIDYNPLPSRGSNLGPTSDSLRKLVIDRKRDFIGKNHLPQETAVPTEMLFASGSGIDPHISSEAAIMQVERVALARNFTNQAKANLVRLVEQSIEKPQFGILGEQRVNVLMLNLALDELGK
jgi:K+-transporting ATPase ATPase C chain